MNEKVSALLTWLSPEEGGRKSSPPGPRFVTVARFEGQSMEDWRKEAWSLVVDFLEPPNEKCSHRVEVSFLSDSPPKGYLDKGKTFELLEGAKLVAKGRVL